MPNSDMAAGQMRLLVRRTPEEVAENERLHKLATIEYWRNCVTRAIQTAESVGVVITVERVSVPPLAMGNHVAVVTAREKRS